LPDKPGVAPLSTATLQAYLDKLQAWKTASRAYSGYRPDLRNTNLQKTDLSELILSGANLYEARMEGANLYEARMEGANLRAARMEGAFPLAARMEGADLSWARMEGASLNHAGMEGVNLHGARMERAGLSEARMDSGTSLGSATLRGATLQNVDYSRVAISLEQIKSCFGDASVKLPGDVTPDSPDWPPHWPKETLDLLEYIVQWHKWRAGL
jgi:uncharacterized protein YjbI with pentapeptide repeats